MEFSFPSQTIAEQDVLCKPELALVISKTTGIVPDSQANVLMRRRQ